MASLHLCSSTNKFVGVEHAFHALALDEHRGAFTPTMWYIDEKYETGADHDLRQCWFPGYHSDVGGGTTSGTKDSSEVDEVALAWMCDQADGLLTFDRAMVEYYLKPWNTRAVDSVESWGAGDLEDSCGVSYRLNVAGGSVYRTPGMYLPDAKPLEGADGNMVSPTKEQFHPLIRHRWDALKNKPDGYRYDPPALQKSSISPTWTYEESEEGAVWVRPAMPKSKGWLGTYPEEPEVRIPEYHIPAEVTGKINAQRIMMPPQVLAKHDEAHAKHNHCHA